MDGETEPLNAFSATTGFARHGEVVVVESKQITLPSGKKANKIPLAHAELCNLITT